MSLVLNEMGAEAPIFSSPRAVSAEIRAARPATNLRQFSKGKLNNFFLLFNTLFDDLIHLILRRYVAF